MKWDRKLAVGFRMAAAAGVLFTTTAFALPMSAIVFEFDLDPIRLVGIPVSATLLLSLLYWDAVVRVEGEGRSVSITSRVVWAVCFLASIVCGVRLGFGDLWFSGDSGILTILGLITGLIGIAVARLRIGPRGGYPMLIARYVAGAALVFLFLSAWLSFPPSFNLGFEIDPEALLSVIVLVTVIGGVTTAMIEVCVMARGWKFRPQETWNTDALITLDCPCCGGSLESLPGPIRCTHCRAPFSVTFEEERCVCGQLLFRVPGTSCPECGVTRRNHPAADRDECSDSADSADSSAEQSVRRDHDPRSSSSAPSKPAIHSTERTDGHATDESVDSNS